MANLVKKYGIFKITVTPWRKQPNCYYKITIMGQLIFSKNEPTESKIEAMDLAEKKLLKIVDEVKMQLSNERSFK